VHADELQRVVLDAKGTTAHSGPLGDERSNSALDVHNGSGGLLRWGRRRAVASEQKQEGEKEGGEAEQRGGGVSLEFEAPHGLTKFRLTLKYRGLPSPFTWA